MPLNYSQVARMFFFSFLRIFPKYQFVEFANCTILLFFTPRDIKINIYIYVCVCVCVCDTLIKH